MQFDPMTSSSGGGVAILAVLAALVGLASTVFWMFVAWRAMRAHEEIATATTKMASRKGDDREVF